MPRELKCPKCGHTRFNRTCKDIVKIIDSGDCVQDEVQEDDNVEYTYQCANCGFDVSEVELK